MEKIYYINNDNSSYYNTNISKEDVEVIEEYDIRRLTLLAVSLEPNKEALTVTNSYLEALNNYYLDPKNQNELFNFYKKIKENRFLMMFFIEDIELLIIEHSKSDKSESLKLECYKKIIKE